jgi:ribosome maturation factor RimP
MCGEIARGDAAVAKEKYALARRITELLEDDLAATGFDLLDVRIFRGGGRLQVRVYIDASGGVDLEGCARASRTVDMMLEEAGFIQEPHVIEVSSPGIRRPLRRPDHFVAVVGQEIVVKTNRPVDGHPLRGRLLSADESHITLLVGAPSGDAGGRAPGMEARTAGEPDAEADEPDVTARPAIGAEAAGVAAPEKVSLAYCEILEANLEPEFDAQALIREDRRRRKLAQREERQRRRQQKQQKTRKRPREH